MTGPGSARRLAITELEERPHLDARAIDDFLVNRAVPIVEGTSVTFVWRGRADAVRLRHFIWGLASTQPFRRLRESDLWCLVLEIPERSRVEYKLEIDAGGETRLVEDSLNPLRSHDPFGTNSVLHGAGYVVPEWTLPDGESRPGSLEEIEVESRAFEERRRVTLYVPARFRRTRRYPLVVVHDGGDYLRFSSLRTVMDNLVHRREIPEMVLALTTPVDRLVEYANDARHAAFLHDELVPRLERDLPLAGAPAGRGLMGASFGAVASFSAAVRYPGFWGRLLLQSGSFAFTDIGDHHHRGPAFDPVVRFVNAYRRDPARVAERLFVSCGTYESLIYENRSLVPLLERTGMEVRYAEARDGHNWENWRDRLREGLGWLFPGPLWLVYD